MSDAAIILTGISCTAWFGYEAARLLRATGARPPCEATNLRTGRRMQLRLDRRRRARRRGDASS